MVDPLSVAIAILSLAVSSVTAWLTLFRRGVVKMTQPTIIFFGSDIPRSRDERTRLKIFLSTLAVLDCEAGTCG
jgi:hypothetical protein